MVYRRMRALGRWLYPPHCLLCAAPGNAGCDLCRSCARELPRNRYCCSRCALPLEAARADPPEFPLCGRCLVRAPHFARARVPYRYGPPLDDLIRRFKFDGRLEVGGLLADLLAAALGARCRGRLVVPVPLHEARLRSRGFDQALLLAAGLQRRLGLRATGDLVERVRPTTPQTELDARARRANVRGAFRVTRPVAGLRLALLDDVMTTGATLDELSRVLLRAGAREVEVWALARAHPPHR